MQKHNANNNMIRLGSSNTYTSLSPSDIGVFWSCQYFRVSSRV